MIEKVLARLQEDPSDSDRQRDLEELRGAIAALQDASTEFENAIEEILSAAEASDQEGSSDNDGQGQGSDTPTGENPIDIPQSPPGSGELPTTNNQGETVGPIPGMTNPDTIPLNTNPGFSSDATPEQTAQQAQRASLELERDSLVRINGLKQAELDAAIVTAQHLQQQMVTLGQSERSFRDAIAAMDNDPQRDESLQHIQALQDVIAEFVAQNPGLEDVNPTSFLAKQAVNNKASSKAAVPITDSVLFRRPDSGRTLLNNRVRLNMLRAANRRWQR
jgi:prefoldin subunit 5